MPILWPKVGGGGIAVRAEAAGEVKALAPAIHADAGERAGHRHAAVEEAFRRAADRDHVGPDRVARRAGRRRRRWSGLGGGQRQREKFEDHLPLLAKDFRPG